MLECYEVWNKPEKAEDLRAKLPEIDMVFPVAEPMGKLLLL